MQDSDTETFIVSKGRSSVYMGFNINISTDIPASQTAALPGQPFSQLMRSPKPLVTPSVVGQMFFSRGLGRTK